MICQVIAIPNTIPMNINGNISKITVGLRYVLNRNSSVTNIKKNVNGRFLANASLDSTWLSCSPKYFIVYPSGTLISFLYLRPHLIEGCNRIYSAARDALRHHHHLSVVIFHIREPVLKIKIRHYLFQACCLVSRAEHRKRA